MKQLYITLIELLKEIPEIKWADLDMGQMQEEMPPVAFPCVLINIDLSKIETIDFDLQHVQANFSITLHAKMLNETNANAPEKVRLQGLAYLDLVDKITAKLQGYSDACFYEFERVSVQSQNIRQGIQSTVLRFETSFRERIAKP
ncbi:hypothetical protein CAPN006_01280 [Capnocytophaga canimorsus]|uniref:hypothetical protein n=1 Tax=Capnocytophaga canimorsus TaxID=28188 RepID=UPI001ACC7DB7|nr:hypothetical protein [Capnocytophaga canimorsus]GIM55734.1 hypothetical protein CAPN006_01280 [Capnocytophaga canimorsus]